METGKLRRHSKRQKAFIWEKKRIKNPVQNCFSIRYGGKVIILFSMSWEGRQWWKTSCGGSLLHWTWDEDDKQVNKPPADFNNWNPPHAQGGLRWQWRQKQRPQSREALFTHAHSSNTSQRKVDKKRRSSSVWWWSVTFTSSSGSDSISCGVPWCIAGRGEMTQWTKPGSYRERASRWENKKIRAWKWSSEKQEKAS